jgi:hypothetical protein
VSVSARFPSYADAGIAAPRSIESRTGFLRRGANWTCNLEGSVRDLVPANSKKKNRKKDGEIEQNARGNLTPGKPGIRKNNARITTACMEGTFTSEFTRVKRENSTKRTNVLSKKKKLRNGFK